MHPVVSTEMASCEVLLKGDLYSLYTNMNATCFMTGEAQCVVIFLILYTKSFFENLFIYSDTILMNRTVFLAKAKAFAI